VITPRDIARVAREERIPVWLAQGLAAKVTLEEALRAERRRRDRFRRLERRQNQLRLLSHLLEREERTNNEC
jgi:hypothetical protein